MRTFCSLLLSTLLANAVCSQTDLEITNLHTFARLYGYVKYFHPSDEASTIDWDRFAIYGAQRVRHCENSEVLGNTLRELFTPITPGLMIYPTANKSAYDRSILEPYKKEEFKLTYWQHEGVSLGMRNHGRPYRSVRVNRPERQQAAEFGSLATGLDARPYRNKNIKWKGAVKLAPGSRGSGHLWLRVDLPGRQVGFFDNMNARPIKDAEWATYEIIGEVAETAVAINIGCFLLGNGQLLVDDFELYYQDGEQWVNIPLQNHGFEEAAIDEKTAESPWITAGAGYRFSVDSTDAYRGEKSALISFSTDPFAAMAEPIFESSPTAIELVDKVIGSRWSCMFPISLYCRPDFTYPRTDLDLLSTLEEALEEVPSTPDSLDLRLGNLVNAWNVFQHFWPYFDVVEVDWAAHLGAALRKAYTDQDAGDFLITLQEFTAPLQDGHIFVSQGTPQNSAPPIYWEWVEDQLVITQVFSDDTGLQPGDIIKTIDGLPSETYFGNIKKRISAGTKGWLDYRARSMSLLGPTGTDMVLTTADTTVILERDQHFYQDISPKLERNTRPAYRRIDNDLIYLNLDKISMTEIDSLLPELVTAEGIICDLRGYPNNNHQLICHLLPQPDTTSAWMQVPRFRYPDQEKIAGFRRTGWNLPNEEPHIDTRVVFITDGSAISYAESFMGFIEGYKLATIVGQPTAGTNGNVNPFTLPGNFNLSWTGMKVVKHDGSQHHAVGILPDILVEKTIAGVTAGRDEFLERAIEVVKTGK